MEHEHSKRFHHAIEAAKSVCKDPRYSDVAKAGAEVAIRELTRLINSSGPAPEKPAGKPPGVFRHPYWLVLKEYAVVVSPKFYEEEYANKRADTLARENPGTPYTVLTATRCCVLEVLVPVK